jgi:hypothetical protein
MTTNIKRLVAKISFCQAFLLSQGIITADNGAILTVDTKEYVREDPLEMTVLEFLNEIDPI